VKVLLLQITISIMDQATNH